jgi:DNA segregation ATPase FtsK/SpoIIIE, S-DNA-T family
MQQEMRRRTYFFPEIFRQFIQARFYELVGMSFLTLAGFIFVALLSYNSADQSWNTIVDSQAYHNAFNTSGALVADILKQTIGFASYVTPLICLIWGGLYLNHRPLNHFFLRFLSVFFTVIFLDACLAGFQQLFPSLWIGCLGLVVQKVVIKSLAIFKLGTLIWLFDGIFLVLSFISFIHASALSTREWKVIFSLPKKYYLLATKRVFKLFNRASHLQLHQSKIDKERSLILDFSLNQSEGTAEHSQDPYSIDDRPVLIENDEVQIKNLRTTRPSSKALTLSTELGTYNLPPLDLLDEPIYDENTQTVPKQDLEDEIAKLNQVLSDYGISGKISRARPGPVVTLYEFTPAPGVKSSRIISLADDIARSMSALSARIAIIPGQKEIGIELPNEKRQTVCLSELLSYQDFEKENSRLTIALGKNISGAPVFTDLARMPHMIVAGTTGSGKSVAVNGMILSLLYRHSPATCRLIMIDPKMLELSVYNNIPHLLTPVVTDPKKAVFALKWTVKEMENRYHAMSHLSVRNIEGYNFALAKAKAEGQKLTRRVQTGFNPESGQPIFEEQEIEMTPLPYIVVFVDEMADLMLVAGKEIESAVQRLAQMARAAGIHVIMATQRPSVDVITGTIKANFPTRISFQVASKFDSKTILGEQGAEQLLGRGDMLFMEVGGKIQRVHGPFVRDEEVERVVHFLKSQGTPQYIDTITEDSGDFGLGVFGSENQESDDTYRQAVDIVKKEGKASTSFIQRRLRVGYNTAARLMEQMEAEGIVSVANHVGKREVLL